MVNKLLESKNYEHFQEMSLEFAKYVDVMTPRMQKVCLLYTSDAADE